MPRHRPRPIPSDAAKETVSSLLARWPSIAAFARDIGIAPNHAQTMKIRGSIPIAYWPATIAAAEMRRIYGVTAEYLMLLHARGRAAGAGRRLPKSVRARSAGKHASGPITPFRIRRKPGEKPRGLERAFEIIANLPIENLAEERDLPLQEREYW